MSNNTYGITTNMAIITKSNGMKFSVPTFQLSKMNLEGCKVENSQPVGRSRDSELDEQFWNRDN